MTTQESREKQIIEKLLDDAGWSVRTQSHYDLVLSSGVAVRSFPLARGYGVADYLLCVDGKASGIIEVKACGARLTGLEAGAEKYQRGLPFTLPLYTRPLPFLYESSGVETRFTNGFDPEPCARNIFAFHKPETLKEWIEEGLVGGLSRDMAADASPEYGMRGMTFLHRIWINMPPLLEAGFVRRTIENLESSLRQNNARTLIAMEDCSCKIFTAVSLIYRLLKFAGARRVLYLLNDDNLKDQALEAFQGYISPYRHLKFSEEFAVETLNDRKLDPVATVCISTPVQIIDLLQEKGIIMEKGMASEESSERSYKEVRPIKYCPDIPIEIFDLVVVDESQQSNGSLLEPLAAYFDAYLIGLSSAPDEKTINFFHQNLLTEYGSESTGLNRVNVSFDP